MRTFSLSAGSVKVSDQKDVCLECDIEEAMQPHHYIMAMRKILPVLNIPNSGYWNSICIDVLAECAWIYTLNSYIQSDNSRQLNT